MTGLEELLQDMTKRIQRVEVRAKQGQESLRYELPDAKSQAKCDQVHLIQNTDHCLAESLALATNESEERDRRMTRGIERLLNDHDNTYAQMMTNLDNGLDAKVDLMMLKLDKILSSNNRESHPGAKESSRQPTDWFRAPRHKKAPPRLRTRFESKQRERPRAAPSGWRLPTVTHVRSVPDLSTVSHDTTMYASSFSHSIGLLKRLTLNSRSLLREMKKIKKKQKCGALTSNLEGTALNCVMAKKTNERDS